MVAVLLLSAGPALGQEASMVPVTVDGQIVRLQMRIYRPPAVGPAPTLVFNHGSTGNGLHPPRFARPIDFPVLARFFVQRALEAYLKRQRLGRP